MKTYTVTIVLTGPLTQKFRGVPLEFVQSFVAWSDLPPVGEKMFVFTEFNTKDLNSFTRVAINHDHLVSVQVVDELHWHELNEEQRYAYWSLVNSPWTGDYSEFCDNYDSAFPESTPFRISEEKVLLL